MNRLKRYAVVTMLLVVGSYLIGDGARELRNSWRLSHEGRTTTGKVFDNSTFRSERNTTYYLSVEFQAGKGLTLREKFEVSGGVYLKAIGSGTVTVHYLPYNPDICVAGDTVSIRFGWLLGGLGIFLAGVHVLWFFRYAGRKVAELCVEEHEFATVDARQFKHLDFAFYEQSQRLLETHGYRFLADREDLTFRRNNGLRIPLRVMVSREGVTAAGIYHLRQRWYWRFLGLKDAKVLDLESKFSNGVWVITTNAQAAGALDQPPGVDAIHLSVDTCFETLIESHGKRVASFLNRHPGVEPARMETLEDVHRMQAELLKAKAEHRRRTGLTKPELQRISGKGPSQEMDILHDGISAGHEKQKGKAA
jgi:hypothetical protein